MRFSERLTQPDNKRADNLTFTQFIHGWVHHLRGQGWDIADSGRGKPSFPPDEDAIAAYRAYAERLRKQDSPVLYSSSALGERGYQEQAARGFSHEYALPFGAEEIVFTPGGQFGLAAAFYMIQQRLPGSKIVTPAPWYVNHADIASLYLPAKSKRPFIAVDTLKHGGKTTALALEQAIVSAQRKGERLGAFLFTNPSNPLGSVMREADWKPLLPLLEAFPDIPILLDEAFAEIVYDWDGAYDANSRFRISLLHAAPQLKERAIVFRSGTKALGFSGERLAVMAVPEAFRAPITYYQSRLLGHTPLIVQAGMAAAMEKMSNAKKERISGYYQKNMDFLWREMTRLRVIPKTVPRPEGCFYTLIDLSRLLGAPMTPLAQTISGRENAQAETDIDLALNLLTGYGQPVKTGLALMPASVFGVSKNKGWCRVSASSTREEIALLIERLETALKAIG